MEVIGTVVKSMGMNLEVRLQNEKLISCTLKGKLRLEEFDSTNPVAVGDQVLIDENVVSGIMPRRNYILRKSPHSERQFQILCANVDQAVLIVTIESPYTSLGFIDRFLISTEAYKIPTTIIINKVDLIKKDKQIKLLEEYTILYEDIGYQVIHTSVTKQQNIQKFQTLLENKTSFLSGKSGCGKSSLINSVEPELNLKVGKISFHNQKGKHTTTFAQMFPLYFGGNVIDAPGVTEFGTTNIQKEELSHFFPEMLALLPNCKFNNCSHIHEPECAVKDAFEKGLIAESRYQSYFGILHEIELANANKY